MCAHARVCVRVNVYADIDNDFFFFLSFVVKLYVLSVMVVVGLVVCDQVMFAYPFERHEFLSL